MSAAGSTAESRARANVARWFGTSPHGPVFLTDDGRVLPLDPPTARTLRRDAEDRAVQLEQALQRRGVAMMLSVVVIIVLSQWVAGALPERIATAVRDGAFALYVGHGIWAMVEAGGHWRALTSLRRSIAFDLRGRVPLAPELAGAVGRPNPLPRVIIAIVLALVVSAIVAEIASHVGIDLISAIPGWAPPVLVALVWALALASRWIDRRRGIAAGPNDRLPRRR